MNTALVNQDRTRDRWQISEVRLRKCGTESAAALLKILESPRQYRWQRSRHTGPLDVLSFDRMLAEERSGHA